MQEHLGKLDINISHELSNLETLRRTVRKVSPGDDIYPGAKVEIRCDERLGGVKA